MDPALVFTGTDLEVAWRLAALERFYEMIQEATPSG